MTRTLLANADLIGPLVMIAITIALCFFGRAMALSANAIVDRFTDQEFKAYPVGANRHIYLGAFVGKDPAGYAKPFEPGDEFIGLAYEDINNTSTAGAWNVRVWTIGDFEYALASVATADIGKPVYATADDALALAGHPDAYVGRIIAKTGTNLCMFRLKCCGEKAPNGVGSIELTLSGHENFAATGATAGTTSVGAFDLKSILGLGWNPNDAEDGGINGEFDATAEVALASCRTRNDCLPIDRGLTMELDLIVTGTRAAAIDIDFGFGTALTTNSEADISHADMVQLACFNLAPGADLIKFQSDDNTTDVAPVTTAISNDTAGGVAKRFKIIVRPTGVVEAWINSVRVATSTAFAMLSTANVGAFVNMEKTSNAAVAVLVFRKLRVAAGMA